jgi:hypothetical protein
VFADAAARTTALTSVLAEGMVSYLQDTNAVEVYNGSAWVGVSGAGDVTEVQAGTGISVASGTGPIPVVTNTMATEITAKGDLIVGTGNGTFDNLPAGTNGHTLVADSVETTGLKWVAASSGALVKLASGTISGTSISFDNVFTNTYDNYYLFWNCTDTDGAQQMRLRVSGTDDTSSSYSYVNMAVGFTGTPAWTALSNGAGADHWLNLPVGSAGNRYSWQCVFTGRDASSLKDLINYQGWFNRRASSSGIISGGFSGGTDFDGFTVYNTGSTFSGTYALYGYSK